MRALFFALLIATSTQATDCLCKWHLRDGYALPKPMNPKPGRKYARDRLVDLKHLWMDVTPDFAKRTLSMKVQWTFTPIALPLPELTLDAMDLTMDSVVAKGATVASHHSSSDTLTIVFGEPVKAGTEVTLTLSYQVQPQGGLYFRTPDMGYPASDTQLWTQGEAELHRFWFPSYDYPNERFTSEVICHVPEAMEVVSNGHLVSTTPEANGRKAVHWLQDKPHVNYLVALAAGYFHKLEAKVGELPIAMLVPVSEKNQAAGAFRDTAKIIEFFQREIGVPFAWDKYWQVYCHDFLAGGMENTSCTFEAANILFEDNTETLTTLHRLDAHETAHQWFGDLVTSRDWSHLWLNEGFASYYTVLYEEERHGRDAMLYSLWLEAEQVIAGSATKTLPTVWRDYADPMEQFDFRVYPKGAWVLHMMRSKLGADLYRKCIQTYVERHRGQVVGTDDLHDVLEELTGLSWDAFFDQWLYHGGVPELAITQSYDAGTKQLKLNVRQTQKRSDQVLLFTLDLPVRAWIGDKATDFRLKVSKDNEDFHLALDAAPDLLRIDPDYTLLAKIDFKSTDAMLKRQMKSDVIGRMLAVRELAKRDDHATIDQLKSALGSDAFYAVRSEAARALKKINSAEARDALLASTAQPDARVRREVFDAIASFHQPAALSALVAAIGSEKNPMIVANMLRSLGAWSGDAEVSRLLRDRLTPNSYRERIASAAIAALRAHDDATAVPAVLARLRGDGSGFESRSLVEALDALAFLARNEKDRSAVRLYLAGLLHDPREAVRLGAAKALGTLRDPAAIAVLEPHTKTITTQVNALREEAENSIRNLQTLIEGPQEMKSLWQRLDTLKQEHDKLQKQVEDAAKKAAPAKGKSK